MAETLVCALNGTYLKDPPPAELDALLSQPGTVIWLDISDPKADDLTLLHDHFHFHPLPIEDVHQGGGRPKVEQYEDYYFIIFYVVSVGQGDDRFDVQPLYLFAGPNYLVSIHNGTLSQIEKTMERWRNPAVPPGDRVGALLYGLLDTIVDDYFPLLDTVADEAEQIEDQIFESFERSSIQTIFGLKRDLLALRRVIGPERDVLNVLMRRELPVFRGKDVAYLQDIYDHIIRVADNIDNYRDLLSSALESYLSVEASRQNQVLKVLTVASIILMADALIAGIYGMNFDFMPELRWLYGYPWALGLMATVSGSLLLLFRRLKWI